MRTKKADPTTLRDLWTPANEGVPQKATWKHLLDYWDTWAPVHELGHALLKPADRRSKRSYARCSPGYCEHNDECPVMEIAALRISARLVTAAGRADLVDREIQGMPDYDQIATKLPAPAGAAEAGEALARGPILIARPSRLDERGQDPRRGPRWRC